MTYGTMSKFSDLYPGQWFVASNKADGADLGLVATTSDGVKYAVILSAQGAKIISQSNIYTVYAPHHIEISVDSFSMYEGHAKTNGMITCDSDGQLLWCDFHDTKAYCRIKTGRIHFRSDLNPDVIISFKKWCALELKVDGYKTVFSYP